MEQQSLFKIRDRRKKGWFFMDNEYLNGYAKCFGAVGTAIYVSLCRHANNETQKCFPSMDLISEELAISRPTIIKYLKLFEKYKIIAIYKEKDTKGRQKNNVYLLLDKDEWTPSKTILHGKAELNHLTYPSKTDSESRVKPVYHKDTNIKETHIKDTNIAAKPQEINNPLSLIVNFFYEMNNWPLPKTPAEQKLYRRWLRPSKDLLELCEGDINEAQNCIKKVGEWALSRKLSWGIETVFKQWYNLDFLRPKEKTPHYDGKRIFQKVEGGKWYVITRGGEIKELGIYPKKEDIIYE